MGKISERSSVNRQNAGTIMKVKENLKNESEGLKKGWNIFRKSPFLKLNLQIKE